MEGTFYPKNDYRDYLAHFGVKGMKWGVRKDRARSGKNRNRPGILGRYVQHRAKKLYARYRKAGDEAAAKAAERTQSWDKYVRKTMKKYPQLKDDFGSPDMIDDPEYFELVAMEYADDARRRKT